jgi:hypothetical protein
MANLDGANLEILGDVVIVAGGPGQLLDEIGLMHPLGEAAYPNRLIAIVGCRVHDLETGWRGILLRRSIRFFSCSHSFDRWLSQLREFSAATLEGYG